MKTLPYSLSLIASLCLHAIASAQEATIPSLDKITVTATRTESDLSQTPASVTIVDVAQQRQQGRINSDVSDVLKGIAGLEVASRHNNAQDISISSRGSRSGVRGVRIYVDGIPATMPDGQGSTTLIDVNSLGRAEMLNGPFSSLYGNSSAGTLLLSTQEGPYPPTLETINEYGSHNSWHYGVKLAGATTSGSLQDYVISINRFTTEGERDNSASRKNQANIKFRWALENGAKIGLVFNHVDIHAQDPGGLSLREWEENRRQTSALRTQFNSRKNLLQNQLGLSYQQDITPHHFIALSGYLGERQNEQYLPIPRTAQRRAGHAGGVIDFTRYYYGLDGRWRYKNDDETFQSVLGFNYDGMRDNRKGYENFYGTIDGVKGRLRRNERNTIFNLDPYVQLQWQFAPKWQLNAGLRYSTVTFKSQDYYLNNGDDSGEKRYHQWLPSLGLSYQLAEQSTLYAAYSRGFETGTFLEMSYRPDGIAGLNFALKPLTSDNYEIGLKQHIQDSLLTLALYRSDTQNDIVSAGTVDGRATYRNAGKTKRQGIEVNWQGQLYQDLSFTLSYNYIDATFQETVAGLTKGDYLPGVAKQTAYAALSWLPELGFRAGADVTYSSKIYVNNANSEYAPSYAVVGAFMGYRWKKDHWIIDTTARVDNLFNKDYAGTVIVNDANQRYYEPSLKRNYQVGVNVKYQF